MRILIVPLLFFGCAAHNAAKISAVATQVPEWDGSAWKVDALPSAVPTTPGLLNNPTTPGLPFINIKVFASSPPPADWTSTIQAAVATAVANGDAQIFFPPGTYNCGSAIVLDGLSKLTFVGAAGRTGASIINYTGTTGSLITLKSASSIAFRNLNFQYSNSAYNGHLVLAGHDGSAADAAYLSWDHCSFFGTNGSTLLTASSLLTLDLSIVCSVTNSRFVGALRGIKGQHTGYSNAMTIVGNVFVDCETAAIVNPGQSWLIANNTFEATSTNTPSGILSDQSSGSFIAYGLTLLGNWYGDASAVGTWNTIWALGVSIAGEYVGAGGGKYIKFLNGTQGISMNGCRVEASTIEFAATCFGGVFFGNDFGSNLFVNTGNCVPFVAFGNNGGPENLSSYGIATGSGERVWDSLLEMGYKTVLPTFAGAPNSGGAVWLDSGTLDSAGVASFIHGSLGIIAPNLNSGEVVVLAGKAGASNKPATVARYGYASGLSYLKAPDVTYEAVGSTVASAATIALPKSITHITGTNAVSTITPPLGFTGGRRTVIPDGAFTWVTGGNIGVGGTAVVGKLIEFVYDGTTWWPSYT